MGNTGTALSSLETLNKICFTSDIHGKVEVNIKDYLSFDNGYEEEMRRQPSNIFYINALKEDVVVELEMMKAEFANWKAISRPQATSEAMVAFSKDKPSVDDINAILIAKPEWGDYDESIIELSKVHELLVDLAQALAHKRSMLEQLAQHERSKMSQYATIGVTQRAT